MRSAEWEQLEHLELQMLYHNKWLQPQGEFNRELVNWNIESLVKIQKKEKIFASFSSSHSPSKFFVPSFSQRTFIYFQYPNVNMGLDPFDVLSNILVVGILVHWFFFFEIQLKLNNDFGSIIDANVKSALIIDNFIILLSILLFIYFD